MATPLNDEAIEKLLEPFRAAVKVQVGRVDIRGTLERGSFFVQGDVVKQMKDNNASKDDADFKQAVSELKIRKKTLEEEVGHTRSIRLWGRTLVC